MDLHRKEKRTIFPELIGSVRIMEKGRRGVKERGVKKRNSSVNNKKEKIKRGKERRVGEEGREEREI